MATNLGDLLNRKMEAEHLSLRAAGEQIGVAHTTVDRIIKGLPVDLDTVEKVCEWLGVPVTTVLDVKTDSREIMDQIAAVLALSPELAHVFSELAEKVVSGEVNPEVLAEVAAFTSYRLHSPLYGAREVNESSRQEVLSDNRANRSADK